VRCVKDVNEVCEEIGKNPNLQRIKQQQEADIRAIKSANRHIKGDIGATANKRYIHAGSLVTQKSNRPNTNVVLTTTQKVYPQMIHRKGGDIIRYFTANGLEVSAFKARKILNGTPLPLPKVPIVPTVSTIGNTVEKQVVPTAAPATQYGNTGNPVNVAKKQRNPLGNTRQEGNPIGEITRATHPSGLVRRAKKPMGVIQGAFQGTYTPGGAVNTATTATKFVKNPLGFVKKRGNPVVDISSIVTPSRLVYRHVGA